MSTLTPNFNLKKPDANDLFELFRQWYNDNLDIIDANLGGGGGSGGHTIIDPLGQDMPQRIGLQFMGANVTDDSVNDKTVVNITGGGGSVNYSLTERVIGTWTNGKPLYECTYEFGSNLTCGSNSWTNTPIPNTDLERVVSVVAYDSSGTVFQFIGANCNSGSYVQFLQTRNAVIIVSGATLRYTKTTD